MYKRYTCILFSKCESREHTSLQSLERTSKIKDKTHKKDYKHNIIWTCSSWINPAVKVKVE